MTALCLFVCLLAAGEPGRVRPIDAWAADALRLGLERSPTLRDLVAELEASDVIVHVETRTTLPLHAAGTTRLAAVTDSVRYVRIVLLRDPLPVSRVAVLGHELQHAVEIARSAVRTDAGMRQLFTTIGRPSPGERTAFETEAAIHVTRAVWFEVQGDAKKAARIKREAAELPAGRDHFH
jgi:hypothetical protein